MQLTIPPSDEFRHMELPRRLGNHFSKISASGVTENVGGVCVGRACPH